MLLSLRQYRCSHLGNLLFEPQGLLRHFELSRPGLGCCLELLLQLHLLPPRSLASGDQLSMFPLLLVELQLQLVGAAPGDACLFDLQPQLLRCRGPLTLALQLLLLQSFLQVLIARFQVPELPSQLPCSLLLLCQPASLGLEGHNFALEGLLFHPTSFGQLLQLFLQLILAMSGLAVLRLRLALHVARPTLLMDQPPLQSS
mmetsp:Transcript_63401/g.102719  ORF Transcript_63401/g.102719 Transcript_63401/m.102719 type:complete len:201 (+) Transcript_63401:425-1027(+)